MRANPLSNFFIGGRSLTSRLRCLLIFQNCKKNPKYGNLLSNFLSTDIKLYLAIKSIIVLKFTIFFCYNSAYSPKFPFFQAISGFKSVNLTCYLACVDFSFKIACRAYISSRRRAASAKSMSLAAFNIPERVFSIDFSNCLGVIYSTIGSAAIA